MDTVNDKIEISLPFKAEYVSIVRLTASGVANRIGFDIDTIEDIKVAVAEVCNKLVNAGSADALEYKIVFKMHKERLDIIFDCEDKKLKCIFDKERDQLALALINALMDGAELCSDTPYLFSMYKVLEGKV
ncbi:serine/threonine-protein kinase RsbW [Anaerobacterium chartisolvens]|uniref:Serine/threonine-protein kinase RsbW n=1 Tax=Anaerobacterium chartisolvens TaxID=1297424 RepID=A0A369B0C1_9FIRM|nr:ATP-binding protein [Anaerobacterium chartisolvens]RCX14863.1 serine/threonine-protein kinase RsbW [Anaerobacterium chartisolvens]